MAEFKELFRLIGKQIELSWYRYVLKVAKKIDEIKKENGK